MVGPRTSEWVKDELEVGFNHRSVHQKAVRLDDGCEMDLKLYTYTHTKFRVGSWCV
jgi:hypothetical protein